ncbi:O-antigen polymerase, putative [Geotalea daltonii FRC-32]|uniref:O-antigen polymerase, putative n=2 Tax=Geotalea TaxID=2910589 RepID=B9M2W3_GEODF|nr:O-antigen polymerase, putative [Geotalea daltonii FRC-32]
MTMPKLFILGLLYINIGRPQDVLTFLKPLSLGYIFGGLTLAYLLLKKKELDQGLEVQAEENKAIFRVLLWVLITAPFSMHLGHTVGTMTVILKNLVLYGGLYYCFKTEEDFELVSRTVLFSILTLSLGGLFIGESSERSSVGTFYDPNDLALVLTSCIPFIMYHLRDRNFMLKIIALITALATLMQIVLTQSRMGFLLLVLASLLTILQNRSSLLGLLKGVFITGVFAVFFMGMVTPAYLERIQTIFMKGSTGSGRTYIWKRAVEMANANPVFGVGFGAFPSAYGRLLADGRFSKVDDHKYNVAWKVSHNSYLKVLAETGYMGLFLYLLLLKKVVMNMRSVKAWFREQGDSNAIQKVNAVEGALYLLLVGSFFLDQEFNSFFFTLVSLGILFQRVRAVSPATTQAPAVEKTMLQPGALFNEPVKST